MKAEEIARHRLSNQQLAGTKFKKPSEMVSWMGAMQAQDFPMAKWAVGMRLPGSTVKDIDRAIDKGEIIRTHVLRPTWHFAAAEDIYWMLDLTAPRIKGFMKSNNKLLGLTDQVFKKSLKIMEKSLATAGHLQRADLMKELQKGKIAIDNNRSSHLMMWAELEGLVCSGPAKEGKPTYALLSERVPKAYRLKKEEALEKLARKYFMSHGPATLRDFVWWSGLTVADAKLGLEMIRKEVVSSELDSSTCWMFPSEPKASANDLFLLPAYDEYLVSYKDRTASLAVEYHGKSISTNGIFWPTILSKDKIVGTWKRTLVGEKLNMEAIPFWGLNAKQESGFKKAAKAYSNFLGKSLGNI